ncbi:MAG: fatty acid cis/trans isomerase [Gammaproteobacteria bacterium]
MKHRYKIWILAALIVGGCTAYTGAKLEQRYGAPAPRDRIVDAVPAGEPDYWNDVKPVIEQRCVVCHACYDAPCQLKMSSIEGIERGASPEIVYDQSRLTMAQPTRLFEDAQTVGQWRDLGFHPVLNEHQDTPEANRNAGVMHRILTLKADNPLPDGDLLPESFDLDLNRDQFCAKPGSFDDYARRNPLWGMPYALPGLDDADQATLLRWLEYGALHTAREPLPAKFRDEVSGWEAFLNGDTLKAQLAARYIYEHLFLGHLYFPALDNRRFFKLVRSATPPGQPVELIATRRPFNDPGVERVYYRIVEELGTIVDKTHMPYALDTTRLQNWQAWFIDADYIVTALPSYSNEVASNPFLTFDDIPVESRYRFLLEEAQFTIMSFIKGPVCRGQVALNVINDHFWVFFLDPSEEKIELVEDFLASQQENIELPASSESIFRPIAHWRRYSRQQVALLNAMDKYLSERFTNPGDIDLDVVWDGDGNNPNAALTVFRHFDSATVEKGLIGKPPKTAWLIGYTLLERIHYLLVAGYDVFGNVGHQLVTRIYMDFLRMEGELSFLLLLPQEARDRERAFWYREADEEIMQYMNLPRFESKLTPKIDFKTDDEKTELFGLLQNHLQTVLPTRHDLAALSDPSVESSLAKLEGLVGQGVTLMPQTVFVEIVGKSGSEHVTLVRNNSHLNITSLFGEKQFRKPDEDTLSVVPGFIGSYPNALLVVNDYDIERFVDMISTLSTEGDYARLLDNYGVRRTNPNFWQHSDAIHAAYLRNAPVEHGLFDYNRLENR